jgi:hypothetical protein
MLELGECAVSDPARLSSSDIVDPVCGRVCSSASLAVMGLDGSAVRPGFGAISLDKEIGGRAVSERAMTG